MRDQDVSPCLEAGVQAPAVPWPPRSPIERLLFGVRGSLTPRRRGAATHLFAPRPARGRSAKPPEPRIDVFGRAERPGRTTWGEAEFGIA